MRCRFLNKVEDFDAAAYGISPTEAMVLDPQQRLMLQVSIRPCVRAKRREIWTHFGLSPESASTHI